MGQIVQMVRGTTWNGTESPDSKRNNMIWDRQSRWREGKHGMGQSSDDARDNMVWDRIHMVKGTTWYGTESPGGETDKTVWDRESRW